MIIFNFKCFLKRPKKNLHSVKGRETRNFSLLLICVFKALWQLWVTQSAFHFLIERATASLWLGLIWSLAEHWALCIWQLCVPQPERTADCPLMAPGLGEVEFKSPQSLLLSLCLCWQGELDQSAEAKISKEVWWFWALGNLEVFQYENCSGW